MSEVTITPSQIPEFLRASHEHDFTCLFTGLPGIGKTEMVTETGLELLGNVKDVRVSQLDPVDVMGVPQVLDGRTRFATPDLLPDEDRDGKTGLFILDEVLDGTTAVLTAIQQLILERRVGSYVLPDGWHIVAMGNKKEHGGINRGLSAPLKDRFAHAEVIVDASEIITYFIKKGADTIVTSFLKSHSDLIHRLPKKGGSWAEPTPRSWYKLSQVRQGNPSDSIRFQLYASLVGEGVAAEFISHEKIADQVPDPEDCIKNPMKTMIPENPSAKYAIAVGLAHWINVDNMGNVMKYLGRLPSEYAVTSIMEARKIKPEIQDTPEFGQWAMDNVDIVLG